MPGPDRPLSARAFDDLALPQLRRAVPDLHEAAWRAVVGLVRVVDRIEADLDTNVHRPAGLTWAGFRVLFCLWNAGPQSTTSLSRLLATTAPTVSSVLNTLEKRGLVERRAVPGDRRAVSVALTDEGTRVVAQAFAAQHERERAWVDALEPDELAALVRALDKLQQRPRPDLG